MTGTYYLWTLLETEKGNTRIERSEGFNFDNQGPTVTLDTAPASETTIRLSATASDEHSKITKYEFYLNGSKVSRTENEVSLPIATGNIGKMAENVNCEVIVYDSLGNSTRASSTSRTLLHTWEKWTRKATTVYTKDPNSISKDYAGYLLNYKKWYSGYTFEPTSGFGPSGNGYIGADRSFKRILL